MADVVTPAKRSEMMSGIRGKNTKPEMLIRKELFARGIRYRLHAADLPGRPDIVFRKKKKAVFVHGCFWHKHDCHLFKWPTTRQEFWKNKLEDNCRRDDEIIRALADNGWLTLIVRECALKGKFRRPLSEVMDFVADWIACGCRNAEISGKENL